MLSMSNKDAIAKEIAESHVRVEPAITRVVRVLAADESSDREPVKLMEVNPDAFGGGILPIPLPEYPPEIPYPSVIMDVTQAEYDEVRAGRLVLPKGWQLGPILYEAVSE